MLIKQSLLRTEKQGYLCPGLQLTACEAEIGLDLIGLNLQTLGK